MTSKESEKGFYWGPRVCDDVHHSTVIGSPRDAWNDLNGIYDWYPNKMQFGQYGHHDYLLTYLLYTSVYPLGPIAQKKKPSNKIDRVRRELQSNPRDHLLQCCSPSSLLWLFDPFFTSELVTRQACPCYSSTHTLFFSLIPPEFPRYCKCHLPITRQS